MACARCTGPSLFTTLLPISLLVVFGCSGGGGPPGPQGADMGYVPSADTMGGAGGALDVGNGASVVNLGCAAPFIAGAPDSHLLVAQREQYLTDAYRLTARQVWFDKGHSYKVVKLPVCTVQAFYNALVRVHNASSLARYLVEKRWVHTWPSPGLYTLSMHVDCNAAWVQPLKQRKTTTGQSTIKGLMQKYTLSLGFFESSKTLCFAYLTSPKPVYVHALGELVQNVPGLRSALNSSPSGDGHDIRAEIGVTHWQLDYTMGSGDCPSGCTHRDHYKFKIYPNGKVTY